MPVSLLLVFSWTSAPLSIVSTLSILLQVLELKFGITASALKWIASLILTGRTHSVRVRRVGTRTSNVCNILYGVPQGSILGPLLFILYTSNITNIATRHDILIHIYADYTRLCIKLSIRDIENAKFKLTQCFADIQSWCASMRLELNASKTELVWFSNTIHPYTTILHSAARLAEGLKQGPRSFKVSGPTIWNDLPARLKDSSLSKNSFRKLLKTFLFDR